MQRIIVNIEEGEHKVVSHKDKRCRGKWEKGVDRYLQVQHLTEQAFGD